MTTESPKNPPMACCLDCGEPLVMTFEFRGYEFICVPCDTLYEFFGPDAKHWTPELQARHDVLAAEYDQDRLKRQAASRG